MDSYPVTTWLWFLFLCMFINQSSHKMADHSSTPTHKHAFNSESFQAANTHSDWKLLNWKEAPDSWKMRGTFSKFICSSNAQVFPHSSTASGMLFTHALYASRDYLSVHSRKYQGYGWFNYNLWIQSNIHSWYHNVVSNNTLSVCALLFS